MPPPRASAGPACTTGGTSDSARSRKPRSGRWADMAVRDGRPQVGIVMGSDSDWETMEAAAERLKHLEIDYEVQVMSAHRSPKLVRQYAEGARRRGGAPGRRGGGAYDAAGDRRAGRGGRSRRARRAPRHRADAAGGAGGDGGDRPRRRRERGHPGGANPEPQEPRPQAAPGALQGRAGGERRGQEPPPAEEALP